MADNKRFDIKRTPDSLMISFSSNMENIDQTDIETKNFLQEKGLKAQTFSVCLVMREALTNAVKHGNKYDESKTVKYTLNFNDQKLIMQINDEGEGFDWKQAQEKEHDPILDHGRGLVIMKQYFTEYKYNEKGNELTLIKS